MKMFWKFGVTSLFSLLACCSLFAYQLAMKNGSVVEFQKYRVESGQVIYTDAAGKEVPVAITDVDLERTTKLNAKETPPLDLSGAAVKPGASDKATVDEPQSLGDAARAMRQQGKAHATAQKRSYSDDDMSHGSGSGLPTLKAEPQPGSTAAGGQNGTAGTSPTNTATAPKRQISEQQISEYYDMGREETARAMLSYAKLPPDTPFPERTEWESRLFEAKKEMVQEYFHSKEHPNDVDLYNRFVDKWNAFAEVANDGIAKARAYLKDHPQQ
jgi:hypothetical protein